jgi:hypothetical protein
MQIFIDIAGCRPVVALLANGRTELWFINIFERALFKFVHLSKGKRYLTHRCPIHLNDNQNFSAIYRCVCQNI